MPLTFIGSETNPKACEVKLDKRPKPSDDYTPETWKDQRGRSLEATYVTSTADIVTLRLSNGKLATMAVAKLSEQSRKRILELATEN